MSWHFSRALVEEYSQAISSDTVLFALSKEMSMHDGFSCNGKTMGFFQRSRYGMTFARLTERCGEELLTSYLAGFHAKPTQAQQPVKTSLMTYGRKCGESWQMSLPGTYLPRTSVEKPLTQQPKNLNRWVTRSSVLSFQRQTWVLTTYGQGVGYLHTPTCTANYAAPSMQKWPSCREFVRVFGKPTPTNHEWLMGWPIGWTDLKPLETDKFQQWRQRHGFNFSTQQ